MSNIWFTADFHLGHAGGWIWTGPARTYVPQLVSFEVWKSILAKAEDYRAEEIRLDLQDLESLDARLGSREESGEDF